MSEGDVATTGDGGPLDGLEPRAVWERFDALRRVPRPPLGEERAVAHVVAWAADHGFAHRRDDGGNLLVAVPASPGRDGAPVVVLQGHLDMVCEKDPGVAHDFDRDPIDVAVEDGWVVARGTTLGADNGIGVAAAMAVAADPAVAHGPLELLFTVEEEIGLQGARRLDPALVGGRLLVNLDSEEDGALYIGCAGAAGLEARLPLARRAEGGGTRLALSVGGLRGGHSGLDALENRGNAVKLLARVLLLAVDRGTPLRLVAFDGGSKGNAIPREATAEVEVDAAGGDGLAEALALVRNDFDAELGAVEPDLRLELAPAARPHPWPPLTDADRDRLLRLVAAAPHGVLAMSREVPGLVETSNNVALVATDAAAALVLFSFRSSVNAALDATRRSLRALAELAGASVVEQPGYPGWRPEPASPLVQRTVAVYRGLFGDAPAVKAVHAGLECGILTQKVPELDAVSFGPDVRDAHSPRERVRVASVARFYRLLSALLADLSR